MWMLMRPSVRMRAEALKWELWSWKSWRFWEVSAMLAEHEGSTLDEKGVRRERETENRENKNKR